MRKGIPQRRTPHRADEILISGAAASKCALQVVLACYRDGVPTDQAADQLESDDPARQDGRI